MSENDFNIVESFAKAKGLSVSAYINSVIKSQTEYFIPLASNEKVSIPKSILYSLFSYASKENLDELANNWATEQEPCYSSYMGRNKFACFTGCHLQNI